MEDLCRRQLEKGFSESQTPSFNKLMDFITRKNQ